MLSYFMGGQNWCTDQTLARVMLEDVTGAAGGMEREPLGKMAPLWQAIRGTDSLLAASFTALVFQVADCQ